jgi:Ice-binding-like/PEP-CTERM motif
LLNPGIYKFSSTAQLNGALILDAQNISGAVFVFQIGTALTTASASSVQVINGNAGISLYWLLGTTGGSGTGSATLGTTTAFEGNILALDSITLTTGASILCGRAFAQNAAVTMDTNTISNDCSTFDNHSGRSDFGSLGFSGGSASTPTPTPVPEPPSLLLLTTGLIGAASFLRRGHPRPATSSAQPR